MAKSAILAIRIVGDAVDAVQTFQQTEDRTKAMQKTFERSSAIAAVALAGITAAALDVADAASEAEQAAGAVESVFGTSAGVIKGYAEDAAQAVGLSAQSYNTLAAVLGAQLTNMGMAGAELEGQTNTLIGLGGDLAATFGGTTADAVAAVSSLLRGERDPIERYGVSIKQADVNARVAAMGLEGLTGEAERNANMQATLAILTEQTASAQGQFAREADTAAGSQQIMTAEWDNARAALGEALLPVMVEITGVLGDMARWVGENTELVGIIVTVIAAFSAALVVARAAQIAMNIAMAANPVGLIITGVGLLIAAIVLVATHWDEIMAAIATGAEWLGGIFEDIFKWFEEAFGNIGDFFGGIGDFFTGGSSAFNATSTVNHVSAMSAAATPLAFTATGATAASFASTPMSSRAAQTGDTYNIDVTGVLTEDEAGRTIEKVLNKRHDRTGRTPAFAGGDTQWR